MHTECTLPLAFVEEISTGSGSVSEVERQRIESPRDVRVERRERLRVSWCQRVQRVSVYYQMKKRQFIKREMLGVFIWSLIGM